MLKTKIEILIATQEGKTIKKTCSVTKKNKELTNFVQVLEQKYKIQYKDADIKINY